MELIFTNDKCIGCNKCIRACSCVGANISVADNGKMRIDVDNRKCIACGACFDVCEHKAREYRDDAERFFEDLRRGKQISLLIAPAFKANYPDTYQHILGGLKKAGANHIIDVSFGADITTWGYLNYIKMHDFKGGISQPCPSVVGYIERYLPELIPRLFPIQSPLMCAAIYAKKYMGITDKLAFISPCIAKKLEITDENNSGYVEYNVTFSHLMEYMKKHHINGPDAADEIEYGLGAVYPMPGGLKENVSWFLGDEILVRQMEGEKRMYRYLDRNKDKIKGGRTSYLFLDALNCESGCICGTGVEQEKTRDDANLDHIFEIRLASRRSGRRGAWARQLTPRQRLGKLNRQFAKLELSDFFRRYKDRSEECKYVIPNQSELDNAYLSMGKATEEERMINCSCCGYETCKEMAAAVVNGFSNPENCIYYIKKQVEKEHKRALEAAEEVEVQKQEILESVEQANQEFASLYQSVAQMSEGNDDNAQETTSISGEIQQVSEFCSQLNQSIGEINKLLKDMEGNNTEVVSIASQSNLLALNASIEASRAGEVGKGFRVVAESIRRLADESKQTVKDNESSQDKIEMAIAMIQDDSKRLADIVNRVNDRTQSLAVSTGQIADSAASITQISDAIKRRLYELTQK